MRVPRRFLIGPADLPEAVTVVSENVAVNGAMPTWLVLAEVTEAVGLDDKVVCPMSVMFVGDACRCHSTNVVGNGVVDTLYTVGVEEP